VYVLHLTWISSQSKIQTDSKTAFAQNKKPVNKVELPKDIIEKKLVLVHCMLPTDAVLPPYNL